MVPLPCKRSIAVLIAASLWLFVPLALGQDCSASNPCSVGCCSKFGFCGFGASFCAPDVCVNNCDRKADCDPGGLGALYVKNTKCPLNVCCSKWGYCGMTKDFCGDKPPPSPNCAGSPKYFKRVVGYYEGWAMGRRCKAFNPEKIPPGIYTHLNFAFAGIDPVTFEVKPAAQSDVALYRRLVSLKQVDPKLKVFIAIGGWAFNDPGPTATTFSDMVSTLENQMKFITSLISFMSTYGFDGVDLDWEYPVAEDRNGRGVDYENLPGFLWLLKTSLMLTPGRSEVSITIPASYWYLQHFDIKKIEKHIDFFNVMSYDLHGTWDMKNKWVGPLLNAHTNLTEIDDALGLLWRNDIDPGKVVMGMAFYSRTFQPTDTNCISPGCPYASGAQAQYCSREIGIAMNSELDDIVRAGATPVLYQEAAVKVVTWDSWGSMGTGWGAYDDEETFVLKTNYARDKCLGGVMVWAVSHDTEDAKFSQALGRAAPILGGSLLRRQTDGSIDTYTEHSQCKWTNCGQACPAGWMPIARSDPGARPGEIMQDDQGCDGFGAHTYCCPVTGGGYPACGWYGHNNGECEPSCPTDWKEVASNNVYCHGGMYSTKRHQTACCSASVGLGSHASTPPNVRLQSQCTWGTFPACQGQCATAGMPDLISQSYSGSGGSMCLAGDRWRAYCCDNNDPDWQYHSCQWQNTIGPGPDGDGACKSGCPDHQVRVAMQACGRGAQAHCCSVTARSVVQKRDYVLEQYRDAINWFLADPTCPPNWATEAIPLAKRSVEDDGSRSSAHHGNMSRSAAVTRRFVTYTSMYGMRDVTNLLIQYRNNEDLRFIWDTTVNTRYRNLTAVAVREFFAEDRGGTIFRAGTEFALLSFICDLGRANSDVGSPTSGALFTCEHEAGRRGYCEASQLQKRARNYIWSIEYPSGSGITWRGELPARPYASVSEWDPYDPLQMIIYAELFLFPTAPCTNMVPRFLNVLEERRTFHTVRDGATEHIIELQTISMFFRNAIEGQLSGRNAPNPVGPLDGDFFQDTVPAPNYLQTLVPPPPLARGGVPLWTIRDRVMNALGSTANRDVFVLVDCFLNNLKARLWSDDDPTGAYPIADGIMNNHIAFASSRVIADTNLPLTEIRNVIAIVGYLNHPTIHGAMTRVLMEVRREFRLAERAHFQRTGRTIRLVEAFDHWMPSHFRRIEDRVRAFSNRWLNELLFIWQGDTTTTGRQAQQSIAQVQHLSNTASINETGFYNPV